MADKKYNQQFLDFDITRIINAIEQYPCNHCGECPIWLAAFDVEELKTYDKVLKACVERNCELVGKIVEEEVLNGI